MEPFGKGWSWTIEIRAEDYSWRGAIHRNGGGKYFKTKEAAERKARAVAKKLNITLDP